MALTSDQALRAGGAGFQRISGLLVNTAGFLVGLGLWFYVRLGLGVLLTWYGLSSWLAWSGSQVPVPPTGPGQYTAPAPQSVPVPSQRGPMIQPVPPAARAPAPPPFIVAQPIPELDGIEAPPPAPPPPPEPAFGVMRGYRPQPVSPRYITD